MANTIRAALVQTNWTGDKESMIKAHEEYARQAAAHGAKVMCFQELFYGPYFCQVQDKQYYSYAESIPGPTTERFQELARELGMVLVLPMYEQEQPGVLLQHGGGRRRRRHACSASTARPTSRKSTVSGKSSTSGPATSATRCSTRR